jgi:hypothetical protein
MLALAGRRLWSIVTADEGLIVSIECWLLDVLESLVGGPEEEKEK